MKKSIIMALFIALLCTLASCGISKPPKESKITEDISSEISNIVIENPFSWDDSIYNLNIKSLNIEKRQTNEKSDTVYCVAELENSFYHLTKYIVCYYTYYDQGGWILEGYENYKDPECTVIANPFDTAAIFDALPYYEYTLTYYNTMVLSEVEVDSTLGTIVYKYDVTREYPDRHYEGNVYVNLTFDGSSWDESVDQE